MKENSLYKWENTVLNYFATNSFMSQYYKVKGTCYVPHQDIYIYMYISLFS